jgi:tight adherence protein B
MTFDYMPLTIGGLVFAATAFFVLAIGGFFNRERALKNRAKVLASYARVAGAGEALEEELARPKSAFEKQLTKIRSSLFETLIAAGVQISPDGWLGVIAASGVLGFIIATTLSGSPIIGLLFGAAAGYFGPKLFLDNRRSARSVKFADELPGLMQVLASGLRTGLPFAQALESAARQDRGEVGTQMTYALTEVQFGSTIEEALMRVAKRMNSQDLVWFVQALDIQREIGGSLSGVLDSVAATIRGRADLRREVRVLSAEGKLSAYVLLGLPVGTFGVLLLIRPSYVAFFWSSTLGMIMAGVFVGLVTAGWFWLQKLVVIEV